MIQSLPLQAIRRDGGTQTRAQMNMLTAQEYADAIQSGAEFPPVVVYHDGTVYWLASGFHRMAAHELLGHEEMPCDVRDGTRSDAIWFALAENQTHGLRRTNADKRQAVLVALKEFPERSDGAIGERCGVSAEMVRQIRPDFQPLEVEKVSTPTERTGRDGRTINTANIGTAGKSPNHSPAPLAAPLFVVSERVTPEPEPPSDAVIANRIVASSDVAGDLVRSRLRRELLSGIRATFEMYQLKPEALAEVLTTDEVARLAELWDRGKQWHKEVAQATKKGLRLVEAE